MSMPAPEDDAALDRRLREATEVPFDDIAVTEAVLARVHRARRPVRGRPQGGRLAILAPAAFASVLVATPFVVAGFPADRDDAFLMQLATGDPLALIVDAGVGPAVLSLGFIE